MIARQSLHTRAEPCSSTIQHATNFVNVARRSVVARVGGFPGQPGGGMAQGMRNLEVNHDPDDLFKGIPVKSGIIQRRMMTKQIETDKEFAKAMEAASDELRKEQLLRRQARRPPANHEEMVEYFLNTMAEDLEYEVARYRPRLTPDFFQYLDSVLGAERFSEKPDEDKLAELDLLRRYLAEASEAVDKCVEATSSAKDRVKKLLTAKDKKEMILEMAAANEIDQALMDLLQQNIDAATDAGQEDAAKFMEKVKQACSKYMIQASATTQPALPAVPGQLGLKSESDSKIPVIGATATGSTTGSTGSSSTGQAATTQQVRAPAGGVILDPKNPSGMKGAGKLIL